MTDGNETNDDTQCRNNVRMSTKKKLFSQKARTITVNKSRDNTLNNSMGKTIEHLSMTIQDGFVLPESTNKSRDKTLNNSMGKTIEHLSICP